MQAVTKDSVVGCVVLRGFLSDVMVCSRCSLRRLAQCLKSFQSEGDAVGTKHTCSHVVLSPRPAAAHLSHWESTSAPVCFKGGNLTVLNFPYKTKFI